jgi:hypothetical protein
MPICLEGIPTFLRPWDSESKRYKSQMHETLSTVFCVQADAHTELVMDYAWRVSYTQLGVYHIHTKIDPSTCQELRVRGRIRLQSLSSPVTLVIFLTAGLWGGVNSW